MEFLIGTIEGLYKLKGGEIEKLPYDFEVQDVKLVGKKLYVCSPTHGFLINEEKVIQEGCWRLFEYKGKIYVSIEGPKIYDDNSQLVLDLTKEAQKMSWYFPHGPPHITDFAEFKGKIIASVEEGNLLVGDNVNELKPRQFWNDMHNLFSRGDFLLVACADGIYITRDLLTFRKVETGYFHAIEDLGKLLVTSRMSQKPIYVSGDGSYWYNINVELPRPTYGVTPIAKIDDRKVIYSTTSIHEIDVITETAKELVKDIPMTRRVIPLESKI